MLGRLGNNYSKNVLHLVSLYITFFIVVVAVIAQDFAIGVIVKHIFNHEHITAAGALVIGCSCVSKMVVQVEGYVPHGGIGERGICHSQRLLIKGRMHPFGALAYQRIGGGRGGQLICFLIIHFLSKKTTAWQWLLIFCYWQVLKCNTTTLDNRLLASAL